MHIAVIGGGLVGLTTAWYLRQRNVEVTVFEMAEPGNGASWGNAGQILPAKSLPLSEPGNLSFALKSFFRKNSPVTAPKSISPHLVKFLLRFAQNSTSSKFHIGSEQMLELGKDAFSEYKNLEINGVDTTRKIGPFTAAFSHKDVAGGMIREYERVKPYLDSLDLEFLDSSELQKREPLLQNSFNFGLQLNGQSFIDPPQFIANLTETLLKNGVVIRTGSQVNAIASFGSKVQLELSGRLTERFDAVVIATGAWLNRLTRVHGVRMPVVAGIGYSMSVGVPNQTQGMLYFPETRLATTNYRDRLRISTFMQMSDVETPRDPRRAAKLLALAKQVIPKADWSSVADSWFGGRPLSGDGKPLIGSTKTTGVYVNAGHGMWGITLAPVSAREISDLITEGKTVAKAFDPLR